MWAESMATSRTVSRGGVLLLCSRDRSRVYGNCSTTTARFVRVAVTIYFYTHEKGVGGWVGVGWGGGGDFCYAASDTEANPGEQPVRGEATAWRCTLVEQRILCVCACLGRPPL